MSAVSRSQSDLGEAWAPSSMPPLCVDLDGSLLRTDSLHEALLLILAHSPLAIVKLVTHLPAGKARFKRAAARLAQLDPSLFPYDPDVLEYLKPEKAKGRTLALFSAADQSIVDAVAAHLDLFDHAQGSNGIVNLSGDRKLEAIRARFGDDFAYLGNDHVDLPIWRASKASLVVGSRSLRDKATAVAPLEAEFPGPGGRLRAWRKALRLHQWAKNALIFAPIALAGPMATPDEFAKGLLGFIVFGLLASVGYIINDLLDLPADRRHANKRYRPFAAGLLAPKAGVSGAALMLVAASLLMSLLGPAFTLAAVGYFVGTVAYSLKLKRKPMLDVLTLAALFTVRVVAGTTLTAGPLSYWLITFSIFLFLSLALVKRYAELADQPPDDNTMRESRGYSQLDAPLFLPFGAGSALASGLIFVVYLVEERFPSNIYGQPAWLWFVFPVLMYWLMRIWRLAVHGKMHQDPVLFALKDRVSLALGAIVLVLVLLAW